MSDALPSDPAELREMIAALEVENARMTKENARLAATLRAHDLLIEALRARIAKLQRQRFGPSSEKIEREIEQLVLALEDLQVAAAEGDTIEPEDPDADASVSADTEVEAEEPAEAPKPRRRPRVAEGTPRERRVLGPGEACPDCGGDLRIVGQDVSELVDLIAAKLKVIEIARPKASCRRCERMVQAPAPSRPIPRSMAGPGLLAHVLVSKFDDHVPLYRQAEVFARMGADIPDTTLVDWCGRAMKALQPVIERIEACVMACDLLHADDTPIRVLDRGRRSAGLGRGVKQGRIWAYVRDQRPWAGPEPPGVVYRFSPDRKGEHPRRHLAGSAGVLQADAYSGFRELYEPGTDGTRQFREAACWAHLRRAFHDVWTATQSAIARDALDRIGALYDLERQIAGRGAAERLAARASHSAPKVEAFRAWSEAQLARLPGKSDLAKAFRYALKRWPSFTLFLEDGRVAIDNNAAERAMRPIGVGREPLALRGLGHRRRDPRPRHDPHRDRQDERPRPPGLPRRPPRPHPRPQGQPDRRAAALELDAQPHRGSGRRLNRGPNRVVTLLTPSRPKRVVVVSSLPLPDLPVDTLTTWQALVRGIEDDPDPAGFEELERALHATMGRQVQGTRLSAAGLCEDLPRDFPTIGVAERFRRGRTTEEVKSLAQRIADVNGWPLTEVELSVPRKGGRPVPAIVLVERRRAQRAADQLWPGHHAHLL